MKARGLAIGIVLAALGGSPAWAQDAPPVGEERARVLARIRQGYPHMPGHVAELFADTRAGFQHKGTRCEVADWFATAGADVAADQIETGKVWANVCTLPLDGVTADVAVAKLGDKPFTVEVAGEIVTVFARASGPAFACCAPEFPLIKLGDGPLFAGRIRLRDLDRAITSVVVIDPASSDPARFENWFNWRGPNAPSEHREVAYPELKGTIEKRLIDSAVLGERRRASVYLPPGWTKEKTWPAVFIGDEAQGTFLTLVEAMIADGRIEPVVLIGVTAAATATLDEEVFGSPGYAEIRNRQYMPHYGEPNRFDPHLTFFADEVTAWASREFNVSTRREDRAVSGFSGGGTMALFVGLRRPDVFGYSIPLSPAYSLPRESDLKPGERAIFHMSGGLYEPSFHLAAKRNGDVMKAAGYDVTVEHPASGHFADHWKLVFGNALLKFFPKKS